MVAVARGRVEPREQFVVLLDAAGPALQHSGQIGRGQIWDMCGHPSADRQIRRVARGVPKTDQFVVHLGHEHLEAGHLLHGQVLADPRRDGLDAALAQAGDARPDRR